MQHQMRRIRLVAKSAYELRHVYPSLWPPVSLRLPRISVTFDTGDGKEIC